jgi:hypothetical protein
VSSRAKGRRVPEMLSGSNLSKREIHGGAVRGGCFDAA